MSRERIHYLDWLKVLIVYGILLFHASLVFTGGTWLVTNKQGSVVLSAFAGFCFPWGIPAMFLIAGADAYFGIRSITPLQFVWRRVLRLLLPMVVGLFTLSPYQRFISSHSPPPPLSKFPAFYMSFFRTFHFDPTLQWISGYWLHLWFLGYLFAISVVCLPFLGWLRREGGLRFTSYLVRFANLRGGILILAAPLVLFQLALRPFFPSYQDWADVATYVFVFAMGALLFSDRRFEAAIRREIHWIVVIGVFSVIGVAGIFSTVRYNLLALPGLPGAEDAAFAMFWTYDVWAWNLVVLYIGIRWLDRPNRAMSYAQESILPFYVIHHPVVVTIAAYVVAWSLGVWSKWAIIVLLGYAITLTLYELGVRRWGVMRTIFGLGPKRRRAEPQPALSRA
ncbi:MAG TPA: acyltransferase family protein [Candidatus Dormibacteraeota bacterium]|nr:acyltransferase family protein [Candidatus Dormibacteraeota bacterium]